MELVGASVRALAVRNSAPPVPYADSGPAIGWGATTGGTRRRQLETYGSVSTLFAVVSAISEAAAQQDWWLDRIQQLNRVYGPTEPARRQVLKHPAIDLWNTPNPFYSRHDLVETSTQHLCLVGECIWVLSRVGSLPIELWPVRPDRMTPIPSRRDFLAGWIYTAPDGSQIPLNADDVIQVKRPNPMDPYRGLGPVQSLLANLDSVRFSAEWNRRFFLNDATPAGVVKVGEISDTEFTRMRDRWYDQHRGVRNAHRVAFLTNGAEWVPQQFTMRDMQFQQLNQINRDMIREAFRVHSAILGQSTDVNRANAEAADYQLAKWNVRPILSRYQGALNTRLLPNYGTPVTTEFCFESPVTEDEAAEDQSLATRAQAYATLIGTGADPDIAAMVCELPPMGQAMMPAPVPEDVPV